jgi:hypothetical protein
MPPRTFFHKVKKYGIARNLDDDGQDSAGSVVARRA